MNNRIAFNNNWLFSKQGEDKESLVNLPHTVVETPLNYFDESLYQTISTYTKTLEAPTEWANKNVLFTIEAAAQSAKIYLNNTEIATHNCGYTAITINLSPYLNFGQSNTIKIEVNSKENQNIPPFGHVIDYMTYGGIYREIYIDIKEKAYIADVFAKQLNWQFLNEENSVTLQSDITLENPENKSLKITQQLLDESGNSIEIFEDNKLCHSLKNVKLWDVHSPNLHILKTCLYGENSELLDTNETVIGFRSAVFKADGFYLNDKKIKLRGLNRHQSYAYVGYAMPKSMQEYDAHILKNELSLNAVRTSHYPQSHHFINKCDQLGLLVFTEIPGWQHIGDINWQNTAIENTAQMVKQYRNHASIILWGVRINESQDLDEFYAKTNQTARALDETRQTSGVRFIEKSSLLEDVYAFNDFSHEGDNKGCKKKAKVTKNLDKGYLISEYNGHMYPTKMFDDEFHRQQHSLRHAKVMNDYYAESDIAGGFGWCMADYNTHKDFGSCDRICYHGVLDMFRNPKQAAYVYKSQGDQQPVLEITSEMEIGEHAAGLLKQVYAITNADKLRVYKNDVFICEYTKENSEFSALPHGPIWLNDFIGNMLIENEKFSAKKSAEIKKAMQSIQKTGLNSMSLETKLTLAKYMVFDKMTMAEATALYGKYIGNWGDTSLVYRFDAIKNGEVVKSVIKRPMKTIDLQITTSHTDLHQGETYDVAAVRFCAVSDIGSVLHTCNGAIALEAEGAIEIVGPKLTSLNGGMGGTYIKTKGESGKGTLTIKSEIFPQKTISFNVICD